MDKEWTYEELSKALNIEKPVIAGFLAFLAASGLAERCPPRKSNKKGPGLSVYRVKAGAADSLQALLATVLQ